MRRDVRARLYGATIHGWNGRARVRIENGKFQFLPTGYRPGNNGRNDRTAWEEASLDEHGTHPKLRYFLRVLLLSHAAGTQGACTPTSSKAASSSPTARASV
uniref:Uncharacterized protein n=1 Tax=Lotharella globosa TaxID=91324 RepID=A0A7S3YN78_9EUKA